jgi:mRNA interferase RelE/StbE
VPHRVVLLPRAERALRKLDPSIRRRVARRIDRLAIDPRPPDAMTLKGEPVGVLRVRVGDWRLLYQVDDGQLTVLVVDLGHRSSIYRR